MTYKKKLIECALPLEVVNEEAAREKSIRHGRPSTLHLWWARRPLAELRAVLFASQIIRRHKLEGGSLWFLLATPLGIDRFNRTSVWFNQTL